MRTAIRVMFPVCVLLVSGCATLFTKTDTGMSRIEPYAGVRSTLSDWKDAGEKPWSNASPKDRFLMKAYLRTIDVPLSLVADTLFLPFDLMFMHGPPSDAK